MGRFKRKSLIKKYKTVKHDNGLTVSTSVYEEVEIAPQTHRLIRDFYKSLKSRNKFGKFIQSNHQISDRINDLDANMNERANNYLITHHGRSIPITLGGKVLIGVEPHHDNFNYILNKLLILKYLFRDNKQTKWFKKRMTVEESFEYFLQDEFKKTINTKVGYPNEIAFIVRIGLIFVIIAYLIMIYCLYRIASPAIAFRCSFFMAIILSWYQISTFDKLR